MLCYFDSMDNNTKLANQKVYDFKPIQNWGL